MKYCEGCGVLEGVLNSHYWKDENEDGHWVCWECEQEFEQDYSCPCGCDNPDNCVYKEKSK